MKLDKNMHVMDRTTRILLGIGLVYFGFFDVSWIASTLLANLLGIVGIMNLFFSVCGFCPLYRLAGFNFYQAGK